MAAPRRRERIASVIEEVVGELLQREIRDPRVAEFTSVTRVEVTPDVRFAKIYVSVMGSEEERVATLRALGHATGFVRSKLGEELTIRHVPAVSFQLDRSLEQGDRVLALINQVAQATRALDAQAAAAGASAPPPAPPAAVPEASRSSRPAAAAAAPAAPAADADADAAAAADTETGPGDAAEENPEETADADATASGAPGAARRGARPLKLRRSPRPAG